MSTIRDVAKKAGVSVSTVSYALNGTRSISAETKKIIEDAMKELDFRPNVFARGLASKRTRILALLFTPEERGLGLSEISLITCAAQTATKYGYHLVMWAMKSNNLNELKELIGHELVDGVIIMEVHNNDKRIALLKEYKVPFVLFGQDESSPYECFVDTDFPTSLYSSLAQLSRLGHRNICFINQSHKTLESGYGPVVRTHRIFLSLCKDLRLNGTELLCQPDPLEGYKVVKECLLEKPELSAFIVMNDKVLAGLIKACIELGKKIPDDISIEALASSEATSSILIPAISTWEMDEDALMELAVGELIAILEERYFEVTRRLIPCTFVDRKSSGIAPKKNP